MPRARNDTKAQIRAVALELFARQGFDKTSLREIAERLDITKAALYYHFPSKNDLLRSLVEPLGEDMEALFARYGEAGDRGTSDPRALLGAYFDVCVRHSVLLVAVLHDLGSLAETGLVDSVISWRRDLDALLVGAGSGVPARMGAVIALGGIQDVSVMFPPEEAAAHRERAVDIAMAALEAGMSGMD
ncbi:TetR family transcriptional regulator [Nocardiopsis sp. TSRI0078]|uniref:TetR/AcrR family transcriptional regulator n=1 Tax=unclassified Nocardiopsis TaxID=2649073 RepID=UPI00093B682C|nr:TetR/AcrR family transcriptional regulator [Nocardiopsis sp. TSRI0078]OKI14671.1 TetR family transcriptional regulator [Nocardiopsis sp. TSRI0078]